MVHYPRCIRENGPPLDYSTMRFDSKLHNLKRIHHAVNNHINLLLSLAYRHQGLQLYHLCSQSYFKECEFGSFQKISSQIKDYISLNLQDTTKLQFYNWISYQRVKYTIKDVVVVKRKKLNILPQFAKIATIIYRADTKSFFLLVDVFRTVEYRQDLTGYIIEENNDSLFNVIKIDDLSHYCPLDQHALLTGNQVVIPKYEI